MKPVKTVVHGLYALADGANKNQVWDRLSERLAQLDSMLTIISGEGFEAFETWNEDTKGNYVWALNSLSAECNELMSILGDFRKGAAA